MGPRKSTVERIKKEVDSNKEISRDDCPSKLSHCDKQFIIYQITTKQHDNATQTTQFINNILLSSVTPQLVRNVLKSNDFCSVIKQKCPPLKKAYWQNYLKLAQYHENWTVEFWNFVLSDHKTLTMKFSSSTVQFSWYCANLTWSSQYAFLRALHTDLPVPHGVHTEFFWQNSQPNFWS